MAEPSCGFKRLEGKVAVVTGGASGIGKATARLFVNHGARVVISDIQDDNGRRVVESMGPKMCSYFHCDVSDEEQVKAMVDWTVNSHGQLDIMFSNAGILSTRTGSDQKVLDLDLSRLDKVMAVNVRGMSACVKHAARAMLERRVKGCIVCTASVAASTGGDNWTDYYMSKHAVLGLMRSASKQLGPYGIRVNCVSPFAVATPLLCNAFHKAPEELEKFYKPGTNLKETTLQAHHVADAVLFLATDDSALITGHNLKVDGGFTA